MNFGHENSGKPSDIIQIEQLESVLMDNDFDITVTISTSNLKWLVEKAGRWVRRSEQDGRM